MTSRATPADVRQPTCAEPILREGIDIYGAQALGDRKTQQDAHGWSWTRNESGCGFVADGLGGHVDGDIASRLAIAHIQLSLVRTPSVDSAPREALIGAFKQALKAIETHSAGHMPSQRMATTLSMIYVGLDRFIHLSVGDSLIYLVRDKAIRQINHCHARADGSLSSVLGQGLCNQVDIPDAPSVLRPGDRFLLATDGVLTLTLDEIGQCMTDTSSPREAVDRMLAEIQNKRATRQDNVTLVAVFAAER